MRDLREPSGRLPTRTRVDQGRQLQLAQALAAGAAVFLVVTAVGGYGFHWAWTGFADNDTLWDWLELVLLPVTLAFLPLWTATRTAHPKVWRVVMGLLVVVLAVLLVGGYGVPWRWTGFTGNTLWDWLKLFLVPFVLPVVVRWMTAHAEEHDNEGPS